MRAACVILAGGEGRRMGGSKPLRKLGTTTLIGNALELARRYGGPTAVAVRRPDQVGPVPARLIVDDAAIPGPLAGLSSAMGFAAANGARRVLTIPCDMPRLPGDLARRLGAALDAAPQAMVAMAASGERWHPVCALWRVEARDRLPAYAEAGRSSLRGFADACGATVVAWAPAELDPFVNANTPEDLAALDFGF
jgi:molybdopterin-guanine dinucleotide biosynthesis protein A